MSWYGWRPYVPVAVRQARALKKMDSLRKKGQCIQPVRIEGRTIALSFWGRAWCDHLEKFSDYENRLPRGRAYVRNGAVCHLDIAEGAIKAMVSGSEIYNVDIEIKRLPERKWAQVRRRCAGQIGSLIELLQGRLSKGVMVVVTDRDNGLFPHPREITLRCTCPDWAVMCKHVAAVLYGVGARLDEKPELLFLLRGVNHQDLIGEEVGLASVFQPAERGGAPRIAESDLSDLFGIEMAEPQVDGPRKRAAKRPAIGGKEPVPDPRGSRVAPVKTRQIRKAKEKSPGKSPVLQNRAAARAGRSGPPERSSRKVPAVAATLTHTATGKAVAQLRSKLGMSQAQFARLLGVSQPTVGNWEKAEGPLNLRAAHRKAWDIVSGLGKREALRRIRNPHPWGKV